MMRTCEICGKQLTRKQPDWSKKEPLSYVIGVLMGDGWTYIDKRGSGYICLQQTREEFAKSFYNALMSLGLTPKMYIIPKEGGDYICGNKVKSRKDQILVRACSRAFVEWYRSSSLEEISQIVLSSKSTAKEFVRGFYESEGTNYVSRTSRGRPYWVIELTNSNLEILKLVKKAIEKIGFHFHLSKKHNKMYRLYSAHALRNRLFLEEIKPCIKNQIYYLPLKWRGIKGGEL